MTTKCSKRWLGLIRSRAIADAKAGSKTALRVLSACERIEAMPPEKIWESDLLTVTDYVHKDWGHLATLRIDIVGHSFHLDQVVKVSRCLEKPWRRKRKELMRDLILHAAYSCLFEDPLA